MNFALDEQGEGVTAIRLCRGVADLRMLYDAFVQCTNDDARLQISEFLIVDDPWEDTRDGFFLEVAAPGADDGSGQEASCFNIYRRVPDDPEEEYGGVPATWVLECRRLVCPDVGEVVGVLNLRGGNNAQLAV